jgi:hypothetical protein
MSSVNQKQKRVGVRFGHTFVVLEALKGHREKQQQARMKAGEKWQEKGLIFANIYGGYFDADHVGALFKKLLRKRIYQMCGFTICVIVWQQSYLLQRWI